MKWVHSTLLVKLNEQHEAKKSVFLPYINFAVVSECYEHLVVVVALVSKGNKIPQLYFFKKNSLTNSLRFFFTVFLVFGSVIFVCNYVVRASIL